MKKLFLLFILLININVYASDRVEVKLDKCVDGDTANLIIDNESKKVRFLAIDTPESVHPTKKEEAFGKDASNFTCDKLTNAKKIEIEYDPDSDKTDKYNRVLAWIYIDDSLLQRELIINGYAKVAYIYGDYLYTSDLCIEEKKAYEKKIGIWSVNNKEGYCINKKNTSNVALEKEELTIKDIIYILIAAILLYLLKILKKRVKKIKI